MGIYIDLLDPEGTAILETVTGALYVEKLHRPDARKVERVDIPEGYIALECSILPESEARSRADLCRTLSWWGAGHNQDVDPLFHELSEVYHKTPNRRVIVAVPPNQIYQEGQVLADVPDDARALYEGHPCRKKGSKLVELSDHALPDPLDMYKW